MLAVAAHAAVLRVPEGERSAPPLTQLTTTVPSPACALTRRLCTHTHTCALTVPIPRLPLRNIAPLAGGTRPPRRTTDQHTGCGTQGNVAACQILCDAGANVNYVCPRGQISCAHIAAANYAAADSLIEILHKAGADLNAVDEYGFSPLFYTKTARGAKMLCGCDADYLLTCKKGNTAQQHHGRNPQNGDAVIVAGLLEEYVRKLKEFELFDIDGDGNLTEEELETGLRQRNMSDKEIRQMWDRLEHNEQGGIGEREYALMSIRTEQQTE